MLHFFHHLQTDGKWDALKMLPSIQEHSKAPNVASLSWFCNSCFQEAKGIRVSKNMSVSIATCHGTTFFNRHKNGSKRKKQNKQSLPLGTLIMSSGSKWAFSSLWSPPGCQNFSFSTVIPPLPLYCSWVEPVFSCHLYMSDSKPDTFIFCHHKTWTLTLQAFTCRTADCFCWTEPHSNKWHLENVP